MKQIVLCLLLVWMTPMSWGGDIIATAKADVEKLVEVAEFLDEKIRECINNRLGTSPANISAYIEPCMWSAEIYANEYRTYYGTALNSTKYLLQRAETLLLQGDFSGDDLTQYANRVFFWGERIEALRERRYTTLGACYSLVVVGIQSSQCCDEFKGDGLNPTFCN